MRGWSTALIHPFTIFITKFSVRPSSFRPIEVPEVRNICDVTTRSSTSHGLGAGTWVVSMALSYLRCTPSHHGPKNSSLRLGMANEIGGFGKNEYLEQSKMKEYLSDKSREKESKGGSSLGCKSTK